VRHSKQNDLTQPKCTSGASPIIATYIQRQRCKNLQRLLRFENKIFYFASKNTIAYYNGGMAL
jgi:hypothetical protein